MRLIKNLILIILLLLFMSCNQSDTVIIQEFEEILGATETKYLNEIVQDFESYLDSNYSDNNIESKYIDFLKDLSKHRLNDIWKIDSLKFLKYKSSNLFAKYDTVYADSVWYDGIMINYIWEDDDLIQAEIPIIRKDNPQVIDSLIDDIRTRPFKKMVSGCRFYVAIDSVSICDSLIYIINEIKSMGGNNLRYRLADGILYVNPDFSDYFVKRIIAIETADLK